jgi:hypothetical protein
MHAKYLVLAFLFVVAVLSGVGLWKHILVVRVSDPEVLVPVSVGDVFFRDYVQSMYHVPVSEKFRIEAEHFRLVHVQTQSEAVLVYLGIEGKDEPNVEGKFTEFSIPAASIGDHVLRFHDHSIALGTREDRDGSIKIELAKMPLWRYFAHVAWR